jgi:hypothetical protein
MEVKKRKERYDLPPKGALILVLGRVHEVTETWEGTGPRVDERGGCYTRQDPGDGTPPTKHVFKEGVPWRPVIGESWDQDRTTPVERALRIDALAHHADRDALQTVLEAGALALTKTGHESRTVERLAAALVGTFDPYPPEYEIDQKIHHPSGDKACVAGRYLNGSGRWEYLIRHDDGEVGKQTESDLFMAWLQWGQAKRRAHKVESEAVRNALETVLSRAGQNGGPDKWEALGLSNLLEGGLAGGGTDERRKIAARLREQDDPTGEVADFADRLEAGLLKERE